VRAVMESSTITHLHVESRLYVFAFVNPPARGVGAQHST
jgi:hypothetical protein